MVTRVSPAFISLPASTLTQDLCYDRLSSLLWFSFDDSQFKIAVSSDLPQTLHRNLIIFNPNTSVHFLHTVLYTFPIVLTRRICLTIKSFLS